MKRKNSKILYSETFLHISQQKAQLTTMGATILLLVLERDLFLFLLGIHMYGNEFLSNML